MEYLKKINRRAQRITESRIIQLLEKVILRRKGQLVKIVRGQWKQGLRPSGEIIGTYKSFSYEQEKRQKNPSADGNVDLVDTGALSKGLTVLREGDGVFEVFSTDSKAQMIADKYGIDVYGLNEEEEKAFLDAAELQVMKDIIKSIYK